MLRSCASSTRRGGRPRFVLAKARIEWRQINRAGEEVMDRVFECPGGQLPGQVDRQESRRGNHHRNPDLTTHLADKSLALISAS
ncbi:MAG: hypothetical protein WKF55_01145 [Gemmatimonadaceae bacterium]